MSDILKRWRAGDGLPDTLVIDGHLHFHDWPHGANFGSIDAAARGAERDMDANGVDAGCMLSGGYMAPGCDYTLGNDDLLDLCGRLPERLIPFASVNPNDGVDNVLSELARVEAQGVRCLKLLNSYQERYPGDGPVLMEVYRFAAQHNMLILNHSWANDEIASIAPQFPQTDFILGHYSNGRDPVLRQFSNVYTSTWNLGNLGFLERGIRDAGPGKFLFGSDAFMNPMSVGIGMAVYADISDEHRRQILGLTQARLLEKVGALPVALKDRYLR